MAKQREDTHVNLNESSVYSDDKAAPAAGRSDDLATDATLDRLEVITGGADQPALYEGVLGQKFDELDASTEEELDALRVNLFQDSAPASSRDGSGRVNDELAEERITKLTEVGPLDSNMGAVSLEPGRDDTSAILRRHNRNVESADPDAIAEGNLDQPMDEAVSEPKTDKDKGTT
jgi:hypothetical protein